MQIIKHLGISLVCSFVLGFIFFMWFAPTLSSGILLGAVLLAGGAIAFPVTRKHPILKQVAIVVMLSGVYLAIGTVVMILLAISTM